MLGNVLMGRGNSARLTSLETELSTNLPGLTVDRQCGSGINAITLAAQAIQSGAWDAYVAGGVENMSRAPYLMDRAERPYSPAPSQLWMSTVSYTALGATQ